MTYIALLRAINVGGHNIKMDHLRGLFASLGFANVRSYIQSGNIFFDSEVSDANKLRTSIEALLLEELGYEVPTVLRTIQEFEKTLSEAPFGEPAADERFLVVFTSQPLHPDLPAVSPKQDVEVLGVSDRDAYIRWTIINGRPPSDAKFLKDALGTAGTARFFHTAQKILAAAKTA